MEKLRSYILILLFLLTPFGFISMGLIHIGHSYFIIISALFIMAFMVENNWLTLFLSYIGIWMLVFLISIMGDSTMTPGIVRSQNGFRFIFFIMVGTTIFIATLKSTIKTVYFYNAICLAVILQSVVGLSQFLGFDPVPAFISIFVPAKSQIPGAITGTLGNPNFLGAFLAVSLPFFFRRKWVYFLPLIGLILFGSKTSSAAVPAILGVGFFWALVTKTDFKRLAVYCGVAIIITILYALIIDTNIILSERWTFWKMATAKVFSSGKTILFGFGPGAFWGEKWPLHSEWVSIIHQFGLVGLFLVSGYLLSVLRWSRDPILLSSFAIIVLNLLGNSALNYAPTGFLICMIMGLIERKRLNG